MESRDLVSVSRRVLRPGFWSLGLRSRLGLEGFRSRVLRLETLHRLLFMKFCKEFLKKTVLKNGCSKFSRWKRSVAKVSLLLCCLRDGENNLPSTLFKIYTEFNKKMCIYQRNRSAYSLQREVGSTLLSTIFELFFQEFCYETHRFIQKRWKSAKKLLFWEAK